MLLSFVTTINLLLYPTLFPLQVNTQLNPIPFHQDLNNDDDAINPIIRLHDVNDSFFCSGVVVDKHHAITAAHCVSDVVGISLEPMKIFSNEGKFITYAYAEGYDVDKDSAIIRGDFKNVYSQPTDFKGELSPITGSTVKACGYPTGQKDIYCINSVIQGNRAFTIRGNGTPLIRGMSGGPVFYQGKVIGVNSAVDENNNLFGIIIGLQMQAIEK